MAVVLSVSGALPPGTETALTTTAAEIVSRRPLAEFADSIAGGVLVTLLSFLLLSVDSDVSRIVLAYGVGVLLALGPFDHVVVTMLHIFFGVLFEGGFTLSALVETTVVVTAGNLVGGIGVGTTTHIAQTHGARQSDE
ncbi:formate/nitrite transporter family protein [Haloferax namakaokahaiae]|uniref:Formate/nitrite transporter family protein n=1 Tax=Haloferax namakaokahaiae TaxID=1748331 RepID=A0ABD5ZDI0_9EURY